MLRFAALDGRRVRQGGSQGLLAHAHWWTQHFSYHHDPTF